jgi:hypothetical protein
MDGASTPPPPSKGLLAALTMASTSSVVMFGLDDVDAVPHGPN